MRKKIHAFIRFFKLWKKLILVEEDFEIPLKNFYPKLDMEMYYNFPDVRR
jgi:hypothetical protein